MDEFELKKINSSTKFKVKRHTLTWDEIIDNLDEELHDKIVDIIFAENNLYYYTTAKPETKKYIENLGERQKQLAIASFMGIIKDPKNCLATNNTYNNFLEYVESLQSDEKKSEDEKKQIILDYLKNLEITNINNAQSIEQIIKQGKAKLANESRNGIFAEILFYKVIDSLVIDTNVLFSKIPAISAAGTYAHGSDGIFIEVEDGEICFGFGEAKFCNSIDNAITQVQSSISDFARLGNDINWMSRNLNSRKNFSEELKNALEEVEIDRYIEDIDMKLINLKDVKKKIYVFMLYGEGNLELEELEDKLSRRRINLENFEVIIICFPIIEKNKLVTKLMERVESHANR